VLGAPAVERAGREQLEIDLAQERRRQEAQRRGDAAVDDDRIAPRQLSDRRAVGGDRVVLVAAQRLDEAQVGRKSPRVERRRCSADRAPAPQLGQTGVAAELEQVGVVAREQRTAAQRRAEDVAAAQRQRRDRAERAAGVVDVAGEARQRPDTVASGFRAFLLFALTL